MLTWVRFCGMRLSKVQCSSDFYGPTDCTNFSDSEKSWEGTHDLKCGQKRMRVEVELKQIEKVEISFDIE